MLRAIVMDGSTSKSNQLHPDVRTELIGVFFSSLSLVFFFVSMLEHRCRVGWGEGGGEGGREEGFVCWLVV